MFDSLDPSDNEPFQEPPEYDPGLEAAGWAALIDFEAALVEQVDELDADRTLSEVDDTRRAVNRAEARQLALAAHWADLHAVLDTPAATPGGQRLVRLGGDGTPEVLEFAAAELGAVLRIGDHTAARLIGDALDLRHRFGLLWKFVQDGATPVWTARKIAERARGLSQPAAAAVDAKISTIAGTVSWVRLRTIIDAAILAADPPQALSDAEQAAAEAGVWLNDDPDHGYGTMLIKAAAGDLHAFDTALNLVARALRLLGDTDTLDQRRAKAVAILANPDTAKALVDRAEQTRRARLAAAEARRAGNLDLAEQAESRIDRRPLTLCNAVVYFHLTRDTLQAILDGKPHSGAGVVRMEDVGPVIADQVRHWFQHAQVTVKPVIDLAGIAPVDRYEVPDRISEAIGLIHPADYYPHATSLSRHQDNDHVIPYVPPDSGGPPGQTDPAKMARLARRHHRIKTHAGWAVRQVRPGAWLWRTPHGWYSLVDQHGTTTLGKLG